MRDVKRGKYEIRKKRRMNVEEKEEEWRYEEMNEGIK